MDTIAALRTAAALVEEHARHLDEDPEAVHGVAHARERRARLELAAPALVVEPLDTARPGSSCQGKELAFDVEAFVVDVVRPPGSE